MKALWTAGVCAAALALSACGGKPDPAAGANADVKTVSVVTVAERPLGGGLSATGALVPREEVAVIPDVAGYRVTQVLADVGSYVKAGQPLAVMDGTLLSAQVAQQEAAAAQARIQAEQAEAEAARVQGLDGEGVLSQEQVEQRSYQARAARAAAEAQAAGAREARTRLGRLTLRAPTSGLVIERTVRLGDLSGGGAAPWFRIARASEIELLAQVSENDLPRIRAGQAAEVILPDGQAVQGTVRLVSPAINNETKLGAVRVTLPTRGDIRAGGFGRANFTAVGTPVLAVPEAAVRYDAEGASVMVVGADNKVSQAKVTTGARGGGYVELRQGPPAGSRVLAKAASLVLAGDVVKPQAAQAPAAQPAQAPAASTPATKP